ncbi:MAG: MgtC/SapB family protein [Chloroflexales bacterium]|nr:MgtC/SapB family protein [Chloroflexales bacterium]
MPAPTDWLDSLLMLPWELVGRITLAAILGGMVGGEREYHGHTAGLRTNILVAVGSCLFTILSIYGFPSVDETTRDPARLAAQIVSGIGFLGAGAVLHDKDGVRGLTTAATIWLMAAIGIAAGVGSYFLAIITTTITIIVLVALLPVSERIARHGQKMDE